MRHKTVGNLLVFVGLCMILCSGLLFGYNRLESRHAEESVVHSVAELHEVIPGEIIPAELFASEPIAQIEPIEQTVDVPYYVINPQIEMVEQTVDGVPYIGILEIPKLNLELPIISHWSNANARKAPCRYKGSAYSDDMIICAHNYKSHFGRLSSLSIDDPVIFTDMEGNQFRYYIVEFEVMDGTAIDQMESGNWDLTLFTCTVGGKSRMTVRCQRADK